MLQFFICLNLFAKTVSNDIEFALDLFEREIEIKGKNSALFDAGMLIGLHRLLNVGNTSQTKREAFTTLH